MDNSVDIIELLDILYGMVTEAWGVPLGNDKCIIEREKAIEIINDIKASLPASIAEAKRLVSARDEFIGNAKREAEAVRKAIGRLAAIYREVVYRHYMKGQGVEEIASALGVPVGTVKSRLSHGRGQMKETITAHLEEDTHTHSVKKTMNQKK